MILAIALLAWFVAVIASFPIVYVKLPSDLLLGALANLGVGWARRWMDFVQNSSIQISFQFMDTPYLRFLKFYGCQTTFSKSLSTI